MICYDGFYVSHNLSPVSVLPDALVQNFVSDYTPANDLLEMEKPITVGPLALPDFYFELKRNQLRGTEDALAVVPGIQEEFFRLAGRNYQLFEPYRLEDAELVLVIAGSAARTAENVVDRLRAQGLRVGILALRFFRPFPKEALVQALANARAVAVMDRADSIGAFTGPVGAELKAALFDARATIPVWNLICGLGGRNIVERDLETVFLDLRNVAARGAVEPRNHYEYLGVRENVEEGVLRK